MTMRLLCVSTSKNTDAILEKLIDLYNQSISKPHPIVQAPKLNQLNQPVGFVDAFFYIKDPEILKQETTIVFGGLFLTILKYFELTNSSFDYIF